MQMDEISAQGEKGNHVRAQLAVGWQQTLLGTVAWGKKSRGEENEGVKERRLEQRTNELNKVKICTQLKICTSICLWMLSEPCFRCFCDSFYCLNHAIWVRCIIFSTAGKIGVGVHECSFFTLLLPLVLPLTLYVPPRKYLSVRKSSLLTRQHLVQSVWYLCYHFFFFY